MTLKYSPDSHVTAAIDVYDLEIKHGSSHQAAIEAAVMAACAHLERQFNKLTFEALVNKAEMLDQDDHDPDSIFYDGVAALLSFAMELDGKIPMDDRA
jgi:hypothetical protein